jgi:hypothetical protein
MRASTPFFACGKDVDGRDKPGHDGVDHPAALLTLFSLAGTP